MVKFCRILMLVCLACCFAVPVTVQAEQLADPMRPPGYEVQRAPASIKAKPEVKTKDWVLSAVLTSSHRSVAVINGKPYQRGDRLSGFKLVDIEADRVVLKKGKKKVLLRRSGTGYKKVAR